MDRELIEYIPQILQNTEEYKAILNDGEQEQVNILWQEITNTLNNQFVQSANEAGISRYEKMLNIVPNTYDTLDARKSRILTRWYDPIAYTMETLKDKLTALCGEGNYSINADFTNYSMTITASLPLSGQVRELEKMLMELIPANIVVTIVNNLVRDVQNDMYQGTVITENKIYTIEQEEVE